MPLLKKKIEPESFVPAWLLVALKELGTKEVAGRISNPRIVEYHKATSLRATDDETPWCSAFVNWCMVQAKIKGTNRANARSWLDWGTEIESPEYGCIVVLKRGSSKWQGHVGFLVGVEGNKIKILGGNQGNSVSIASFKKSDVIGYRKP